MLIFRGWYTNVCGWTIIRQYRSLHIGCYGNCACAVERHSYRVNKDHFYIVVVRVTKHKKKYFISYCIFFEATNENHTFLTTFKIINE